jgi:hypothetical protein
MKPKIKPHNPYVVLARFRKAGYHEKPEKSLRRHQKQALSKLTKQSPESWQNDILNMCRSAMIWAFKKQVWAPAAWAGSGVYLYLSLGSKK